MVGREGDTREREREEKKWKLREVMKTQKVVSTVVVKSIPKAYEGLGSFLLNRTQVTTIDD